jgi:hypothetical protein
VDWIDLAQEGKKQVENWLVPGYDAATLKQIISDFSKERRAFMSTNID